MKIAIVGTGNVGTALKTGLEGGHQVHTVAKGDIHAEAAWADIIILAVPFGVLSSVAVELGDAANGKTVVDATNALKPDMSLAVGFTTSGAEELQKLLPGAHIVKAFNTVFAPHMSTGKISTQQLTMFAAGDNQGAKDQVLALGKDIGFDAIDAGPLSNARALESIGFLNIQLAFVLGHGVNAGFKYLH